MNLAGRLAISLAGFILLAAASGLIYQEVSESRDLERFPAPGEMFTVDGRSMHIHCLGEGSPTVVFELGIGTSSASWSDVHGEVSQFTKSCVYDRPGLGYSEPTDLARRAADVAVRLKKLLTAAGIADELVLVGWSSGGIYAREYYAHHPQEVRAMIFVDSSHEQQASRTPASSGSGSDPMLKVAKRLAPFGLIRLSGILEQRIENGNSSDALKPRLKAIYQQSHILDSVWRESEAFNFDIDASEPPASLGDLPLVVMTRGIEDGSEEEARAREHLQTELAQLSTCSKQIIASGSGHHIYADQPGLLVTSIVELVEQLREKKACPI